MLNPDAKAAPADVLILPMTDDLSPAISFATALRGAGVRAQLYCENKKFKAKLSYADKLSIPFAAFLGEDEIQAGTVTVKYLAMAQDFTPEELGAMEAEGLYKQITLPPEEAVAYVQKILAGTAGHPPILDKAGIAHKYGLEKPTTGEPEQGK